LLALLILSGLDWIHSAQLAEQNHLLAKDLVTRGQQKTAHKKAKPLNLLARGWVPYLAHSHNTIDSTNFNQNVQADAPLL
jgi:hypothetical protein